MAEAKQHLAQVRNKSLAAKLLIGPEGGLSDRETQIAIKNSFQPAHLGPCVLRTETAAFAAIAIC